MCTPRKGCEAPATDASLSDDGCQIGIEDLLRVCSGQVLVRGESTVPRVYPFAPSKQNPKESTCWAECVRMVGSAYGIALPPNSDMLKEVFKRARSLTVCRDVAPALTKYGLTDGSNDPDGLAEIVEIRKEIDANRPLVVVSSKPRTGVDCKDGHYVVIAGYTDTADGGCTLEVVDPLDGKSHFITVGMNQSTNTKTPFKLGSRAPSRRSAL